MQDFFGRAKAAPDRVVVVLAEQGRSCTAGALAQQALQMAQWLAAQGLQPGERFAVLLENRAEILALVLATSGCALAQRVDVDQDGSTPAAPKGKGGKDGGRGGPGKPRGRDADRRR